LKLLKPLLTSKILLLIIKRLRSQRPQRPSWTESGRIYNGKDSFTLAGLHCDSFTCADWHLGIMVHHHQTPDYERNVPTTIPEKLGYGFRLRRSGVIDICVVFAPGHKTDYRLFLGAYNHSIKGNISEIDFSLHPAHSRLPLTTNGRGLFYNYEDTQTRPSTKMQRTSLI